MFSRTWILFSGFRVVIVIKVVRTFRDIRIIGVIRVIAGITIACVIMLYNNGGFRIVVS